MKAAAALLLTLAAVMIITVGSANADQPFIAVIDPTDWHWELMSALCEGHKLPCVRYGGDLAGAMFAAANDRPTVSVVMYSSPHYWQPWYDGLAALDAMGGPVFLPVGNSPEWAQHPAYSDHTIIVGALDIRCRPHLVTEGVELWIQAPYTSQAGMVAALRQYNETVNNIPWDKTCIDRW